MNRPKLEQDAERARRLIGGLNDEHSVRTLRRYVEELEAQLLSTASTASADRRV
jgi:hypothetical protein